MRKTEPHRMQFDGLGDQVSAETAISFIGAEDVTRQEFMRETDVNYIINRYGLPGQQQQQFGESFQGTDLQEAIRLQNELKNAFERLPEALRRQYGSWGGVIAAADRGELTADDLKVVDEEQDVATRKDPNAGQKADISSV